MTIVTPNKNKRIDNENDIDNANENGLLISPSNTFNDKIDDDTKTMLTNLGMRIRSSVDRGYVTPTSSPNMDIKRQQSLYNTIEPPATPAIFRSASESLNLARCNPNGPTSFDVFGSPLPLPNTVKNGNNNNVPASAPQPTRPSKNKNRKRPGKYLDKSNFNMSKRIVDEDYASSTDEDDDPNGIFDENGDENMLMDQRPKIPLKKSSHFSSPLQNNQPPLQISSPFQNNPSYPVNNFQISSPTNNRFSHLMVKSSSPEPWKQIDYSAFANMNPDETSF